MASARRDGSRRRQARLLLSALALGAAGLGLAPPALSSPPAPAANHEKSDQPEKKEAGKTPTVATVGPSGKIERKPEKPEAKPAASSEGKTDGKGDAKVEAKAEGKSEGKTAGKTDGKGDAKVEAKAEGKTAGKGDAKAEAKSEAKKPEKAAAGKGAGKSAAGDDDPAAPLTPPIKMSALREEMSRPPRKEERSPSPRSERERLEQLAAEINKAREGLRQDTARLEALLAARDAAVQAAPPAPSPAGGGDGDPPKKTPTSLDNLAKAIRGMKPEQAAPIISRVDRKLAADVLLRMPGGDAGKVMGVCKPEVAAELAAEIASRTPRAELHR